MPNASLSKYLRCSFSLESDKGNLDVLYHMHNDSKVAIDHILRTLDEDDNGKDDWRACGSNIIVHVQTCLDSLDHVRTFAPQDKNHRILQGVLQQARHHIENQHHSKVQRQWRRLYTDTAILQGIATLMTEEGFGELDAERAQTISGSIRDLDIAIVQCGAPGYERLDMLHQVIQLLQERISAKERTIEVRPAPSNVVSDLEKCDDYCLAKQTVRQMDTIPSLRQYQQELHKTPLVVRGYALDWPALKDDHRHWSDINYLLRVAGPSRVVPVEIGRLYLDKDWSQAIILWTEFLESSGWDKSKGSQADQVIYLAQHNLFKQFPQLEEDIVVPDIVYACPPSPSSFIQYSPPLDEDGTEICVKNAWIGPKGTTSPPHYDPYYNAYVQVVGHKLVWLADPAKISDHCTSIDGNTLDLDVFDKDQGTKAKYDEIRGEAMKLVLSPGDLLIMPPGWYHAMRSLTKSFSVSMWY